VRKRWMIGLITVAVLAGAIVANAAVRSRTNARETGPATGLIRATRYWDIGPSAYYSGDTGSIGGVRPLRLTFPAGADYDAVVTLTLDYRTSPPDDRFIAAIGVREGAEFGPVVHATPDQRPLRASTVRSSVTLTFRFSGLNGGTEYWFEPGVNALRTNAGNSASIEAQHVLMVVDATQSLIAPTTP
jgi:hypothetical protein